MAFLFLVQHGLTLEPTWNRAKDPLLNGTPNIAQPRTKTLNPKPQTQEALNAKP